MPAYHNVIKNCDTTFFFYILLKISCSVSIANLILIQVQHFVSPTEFTPFPILLLFKYNFFLDFYYWHMITKFVCPALFKTWLVCCMMYVVLYCSVLLL